MANIVIIGEKIISSTANVKKIMETGDEDKILELAVEQIKSGASIIDINASMLMDREAEALLWAAETVLKGTEACVSADSPDTNVLKKALDRFGSRLIINSLQCENDLLSEMFEPIAELDAGVIIMLKDSSGIPSDALARLKLAEKAAALAAKNGIKESSIYFDPIVTSIGTEGKGASIVLETIAGLRDNFPEFRRIAGLSNVSYGMPLRRLINSTFLSMALGRGLDAVICDPTDKRIRETLKASKAILGIDRGCRDFLSFYRES